MVVEVMKKILFIINSLSMGGAERVVALLAKEMASKENEVYIICFDDGSVYNLPNKVKVILLDGNKKYPWHILKNKYNLEKTISSLERQGKFDLITVHLFYSHLITSLSRYKNRATYVMHSVYSRKFKKNILYKLLLKFIYKNRNIVTVSEGLKYELINYWNLKGDKDIVVINNPIDIAYIKEKALEKNQFEEKYIISAGRLTEAKRFNLLIRAYLQSNIKNEYKLIILGEGEERQKLSQLISSLNGEDYVFLKGWEDNPFKWIRNASLYVCTSRYECFPMILLESLCCKTSIVSFDCDYGPREILQGELKKFLVEDGCIDDLIKAIEEAVKEYPYIGEEYYSHYNVGNIANLYLQYNSDV